MKFYRDIIKKALFVRSRAGVPERRQLLNPSQEWFVCLVISFLVACGLFAHAGWEFYIQSIDANLPEVSEEHIPRYRAVDAELLIRYYEGKREVWNELKGRTFSAHIEETVPPPSVGVQVDEQDVPSMENVRAE